MGSDWYQEIKVKIEAELAHLSEPLLTTMPRQPSEGSLCAWLAGDWDIYAKGYKKAGDVLVEYLTSTEGTQAYLYAYPIAFLYRHYLELRLKELLRLSSELLGEAISENKTHDLMTLWRALRPRLEVVWGDDQAKRDDDKIEARLRELVAIDARSTAFRYPDKEGHPFLNGLQYVNLAQLRDVVRAISHVLDGASTGLSEYLHARREMTGP